VRLGIALGSPPLSWLQAWEHKHTCPLSNHSSVPQCERHHWRAAGLQHGQGCVHSGVLPKPRDSRKHCSCPDDNNNMPEVQPASGCVDGLDVTGADAKGAACLYSIQRALPAE